MLMNSTRSPQVSIMMHNQNIIFCFAHIHFKHVRNMDDLLKCLFRVLCGQTRATSVRNSDYFLTIQCLVEEITRVNFPAPEQGWKAKEQQACGNIARCQINQPMNHDQLLLQMDQSLFERIQEPHEEGESEDKEQKTIGSFSDITIQTDLNMEKIQEVLEERTHCSRSQLSSSRIHFQFSTLQHYSMDDMMEFYLKVEQIETKIHGNKRILAILSQNCALWKKNKGDQQFYQNYYTIIDNSAKLMLIREMQIKSLIFLVQNYHLQNSKQTNEEKYGKYLEDYSMHFDETEQPNIKAVSLYLDKEGLILDDQVKILEQILQNVRSKTYLQNLYSLIKLQEKLKIEMSKLTTMAEIFPYVHCLKKNDIMSLPKTHQRWKNISQYYTIVNYGNRTQIQKSFDKIKQNMNLINSVMGLMKNDSLASKGKWRRILKCLIFKNEARHEAQQILAKPETELPKQIWDMSHKKSIKPLVKLTSFSEVQYTKKLYLQRKYKGLIYEDASKFNFQKISSIKNPQEYYNDLKIKRPHSERILIRINSPIILKKRSKYKLSPEEPVPNKVFFHMHGSGFIGMSTFIHQSYIRNWAKSLNVPFLSVQYGKAPQFPFPCAIEDCLEAFLWMIYEMKKIYYFEPEKVVLVGDSSGGNLAAVLASILVEKKIFKPSGVVMIYPALNLNYKSYTPSLLSSLNDLILPHTFLKICLECYIQNQELKPESDPLLSPLFMKEEVLEEFPPTHIYIGDVDAFHDDAIRLTERMNTIKPGNCILTVFQEFPHGFIMFDLKMQEHKECKAATKTVENGLASLIYA